MSISSSSQDAAVDVKPCLKPSSSVQNIVPNRPIESNMSQNDGVFRIRYLQENIENVCMKRKELIADMNTLKRKLSAKLEVEVRKKLEQETRNLEPFIVGLYIDEDIIKRELDKVRGKVRGQPNQPVPGSLLLPEEMTPLQTQSKIPLILMTKLLTSQYDTLSALKVLLYNKFSTISISIYLCIINV